MLSSWTSIRTATASRARISTGPSRPTGGERKTLPSGTPLRTTATAFTLSPPVSSSISAPLSMSWRRASATDSQARGPVARKRSEGEYSTSGPAQSVGAGASTSPSCGDGGCASGSLDSSSLGSADAASRSCQRTPSPPISSSVRPA